MIERAIHWLCTTRPGFILLWAAWTACLGLLIYRSDPRLFTTFIHVLTVPVTVGGGWAAAGICSWLHRKLGLSR
jgi:hypothetical protein